MTRKQIKPVYAVLGAALLAILVMPLAFAGAADGPQASSSASVRQQVKKLKTRIAALEANGGGDTRPSGPAGGDLAGSYPNPNIDQNAVGTNEVTDNTLTGADIEGSSIGASDMGLDSVGSLALAADSVGVSELKTTYAVVTGGVDPGSGYASQTATCNAGDSILGGGHSWDSDAAATIVHSTPDGLVNPIHWVVRGGNTGATNTLRAWAVCLTG